MSLELLESYITTKSAQSAAALTRDPSSATQRESSEYHGGAGRKGAYQQVRPLQTPELTTLTPHRRLVPLCATAAVSSITPRAPTTQIPPARTAPVPVSIVYKHKSVRWLQWVRSVSTDPPVRTAVQGHPLAVT